MRDVESGGQRRLFADPVRPENLGDLDDIGAIGRQIGDRDRAVGRAQVDAESKSLAHEVREYPVVDLTRRTDLEPR